MYRRVMKMLLCGVVVLGLLLALGAGLTAAEEEFPTGPIYIIVGYGPGGGTDVPARALAMVAPEYLNNQPLVVVNKTGGAGMLAPKFVAAAKPDGYTLLMGWGGTDYTLRRHVTDVPFDMYEDFKPVITVCQYSGCVAVPGNSPFKSLDDLVDYARAHPGELSWGHTARGGEHHANGVDFITKTGIDVTEIPYHGGPETRNAVAGGHVDLAFFATFLAPEMVAEGMIRVLGVCTEERSPFYPDYPTFKEQGYDSINAPGIKMVAAPAGTPDWKIQILHDAFKKCMEHRAAVKFMETMRLRLTYLNPEDSLKLARKMDQKYAKLVEQLGVEKLR